MARTTSTAPVSTGQTNPNASGTNTTPDESMVFGDLGIGLEVNTSAPTVIALPPEREAALTKAARYFAQRNYERKWRLGFARPTAGEAAELRKHVFQYASNHEMPATVYISADGPALRFVGGKFLLPDSDAEYTGTTVYFRFGKKRASKTASTNGPVTATVITVPQVTVPADADAVADKLAAQNASK